MRKFVLKCLRNFVEIGLVFDLLNVDNADSVNRNSKFISLKFYNNVKNGTSDNKNCTMTERIEWWKYHKLIFPDRQADLEKFKPWIGCRQMHYFDWQTMLILRIHPIISKAKAPKKRAHTRLSKAIYFEHLGQRYNMKSRVAKGVSRRTISFWITLSRKKSTSNWNFDRTLKKVCQQK